MTDIVLEARSVTKRFGSLAALDRVNLAVVNGAVHAIIGPNGAGKTTLFNILSGELQPTSGSVWFQGCRIDHLRPFERVRLGTGRSFQVTSVFRNATAFENVRVAAQARDSRGAFNFLARADNHTASRKAAEAVLQRVGLGDLADVRAGELSHGRQRILEVAIALASEPRLLLLDEPTSGMGVEDIERMRSLLVDLGRDHTIVLIEHNVTLVMDVCQTVTVLDRGRVLVEGPPEVVSQDSRVREAYLGVGI